MAGEGRTIVVGDIHGCYDELVALLDKLAFGKDDRLIAVGDLIVKGPKSRDVLELFMRDERLTSVLGNHDRALLRYWRGKKSKLNKPQTAFRDEAGNDWSRYSSYLASLPLMIDLGSHLIVHAGVRPGVSLQEQSPKDLTELRTLGRHRTSRKGTPWYDIYDGDKVVLFGHWPAPLGTRITPHAIGLDTGCVYGNELTAYIVETGEFVSAPALRDYRE